MVDDQFENASNIYTIQKMNNSTGIYENVVVRLNTPYELKLVTSRTDDYRKVVFKDNSIITSIGDLYNFNDSYWFCTDGGKIETPTNSCLIQRCNNTFTFYPTPTSLPILIPCIITDKLFLSEDENKVITTVDNQVYMIVSSNSTTQQIKPNNIFKIGLHSYEVITLPDDITKPNLLIFKLKYSEVSQPIPIFTLEILNGDSIQVNENDPLTINAQVKIDGVIVSIIPSLVFSSSDITIATINSSTGVVTILDVGGVVFSCKLANDLTIMDDISVEIVSEQQNNYTVEISGSTSIIKTYTKEFLAVFKNNGLPIIKESSFWLTGIDNLPTTLAVITSQNAVNNTCIIKGNNLGYVKLWCKSVDEEIVSQDGMVIQVKSLF